MVASGDGRFGVDGATRLRRVILRLGRAMNESSSSEDLTPTQAAVLGAIVGRGPVSASEIARVEGLNPTMLSRVLSALERRGLILRSIDEGDQRRIVIEATGLGRDTFARVRERRARVLVDVVASLPADVAAAIDVGLPALEVLAESLAARTGADARE